MRFRERVVVLMLSMVMVLTLMPALAFAENEATADLQNTQAVEKKREIVEALTEAPALTEADPASNTADEDWFIYGSDIDWLVPGEGAPLMGFVQNNSDNIELEGRWIKGDTVLTDWANLIYDGEAGYYFQTYDANEAGQYTFCVRETANQEEEDSMDITVYPCPEKDGLYYCPFYDDQGNLSYAYVEEVDPDALQGDIVISPTMTFADGVTRTVTECYVFSPNATSINIPASVEWIWEGVGSLSFDYDDDDNIINLAPIPGFVIYGTAGTAAQEHANKYGLTFIDTAEVQPPDGGDNDWHADNVVSVKFYPVGDADRFTFYKDANPYNSYYVPFQAGDKIAATLSDGSTKTLIYHYEYDADYGVKAYWWIENDRKELISAYTDSNGNYRYIGPYITAENPEWSLGRNKLHVVFGTHEVTDTSGNVMPVYIYSDWFYGTLKENPVSAIVFRPTGTNAEISERFTFPEGLDYYNFPFADGDKLTVTINGQRKEYIYDDSEGEFYCEHENLPYEYGYLYYEGLGEAETSTWTAGNDYNVYLVYGGAKSFARKFHIVENPVSEAAYIPNGPISEAKMRLYEDTDEEGGPPYYYDLGPLPGDRLVVSWVSEEVSEYVFDAERNAFVDENGNLLPYSYYAPEEMWPEESFTDHITKGTHEFYTSYLGHTISFMLDVTESDDDEFELVEYIMWAEDYLMDKDDELDWSNYRDAQQDELYNLYLTARNTIYNAESIDEVDAALDAYDKNVAAVKTDAQLKEEERQAEEARKAAAAAAAAAAPAEIQDLPAVKITKPAAAKKKITVKWKKVSKKNLKKISGIQIQVATDPGFTNIVKTATAGKKKTSKAIKGLQSKTKYYVRIRAYAAGNHVSGWKSKSVKVK